MTMSARRQGCVRTVAASTSMAATGVSAMLALSSLMMARPALVSCSSLLCTKPGLMSELLGRESETCSVSQQKVSYLPLCEIFYLTKAGLGSV